MVQYNSQSKVTKQHKYHYVALSVVDQRIDNATDSNKIHRHNTIRNHMDTSYDYILPSAASVEYIRDSTGYPQVARQRHNRYRRAYCAHISHTTYRDEIVVCGHFQIPKVYDINHKNRIGTWRIPYDDHL